MRRAEECTKSRNLVKKEQGQLGQVAINRDAVTRESANGSTGKTRTYVSRTAKGSPSIAEMRRVRDL